MKRERLPVILLILISIFAYANSLNNEFLNWDDGAYVFDNEHIKTLTPENIRHLLFDYYLGEWFPVQMLSYLVDYQMWGLDVRGYHLTNLFFHTGSVVLIYHIFNSLGYTKASSFIAGMLFALFPPSVEAVSWISQRKSVMSAFFMLLSFYLYVRSFYHTSIIVFVLSILSKSTALLFAGVPFFYEVLIKESFNVKSIKRGAVKTLPFLIFSLFILFVFAHGQRESGIIRKYDLSTFFNSFTVLLTSPLYGFISKLFLPVNLNPFYPPPDLSRISAGMIVLSVLFWAGALNLIFTGRDRMRFFWLAYFFIFAFPVLVMVTFALRADPAEISPNGGDRHLYFIFPAFAGILLNVMTGYLKSKKSIFAPLILFWISSYFILVVQRNHIWQNDFSLWADAVKKTPEYFFTQLKAGDASLTTYYKTKEEKYLKFAISHLRKSIELSPHAARAHYLLAEALEMDGEYEEALRYYEESIKNAENQSPYPYRSIGRIYYNTGRYSESIRALEKAIEIDPAAYVLWNEKGMAELKAGLYDSAIASFERSLLLNYNQYDIHRKLGAIYFKEKKDEATALNHFEASLRLNPYQEDAETLVRVVEELRKKIK